MTDTPTTPTAPAAPAPVPAEFQAILNATSANPALVAFPSDQWGMTSELRRAGLRAASSIRGNPEKLQTFLRTLSILAVHAKARIEGDRVDVELRLAENQARFDKERVYGTPVALESIVPAVPTT